MFRVLVPALLLATPALAQHDGHAPAAKKEVERKICKRDGNTASRLGAKRICLTAAQWRERDRDMTGIEERRNDRREREER